MVKEKLVKSLIEGVSPRSRDIYLRDEELPGFGIRIKPSGRRVFFVEWKDHLRRSRRQNIGRFGIVTVEEARQKARKILAQIELGEDPFEKLEVVTFKSVADRYMKEYAIPKKKPKSVRGDKDLLDRKILPFLGDRNIREIDRKTVVRLHHQISEDTPVLANRALALLSKIFNLCEVWEYRPDYSNPCHHVQKNKEHPKERFLSMEELHRLWIALAKKEKIGRQSSGSILAVRLLLLTGARKGEILGLTWDMVDLDKGVLNLPDSKTGAKTIYLSDVALELLRGAPQEKGWKFVCRGKFKNKPIQGLQKEWERIREAADLQDVRLHDLRHTYASLGVEDPQLSLSMIGGLLGHKEPRTTARYAHLSANPMRKAANRIGARFLEAINNNPKEDQ